MFISPPSLLITDDDGAFREALCSVFAPRGFNTLTARDGDEALEIVRRQPVHILLTDMHMPRLSGLETIRRIRQRHLILPCILLSAGLDDGLMEEARDLQAFSVLRKPVRFSELTGVVRQALRVTYGWAVGEEQCCERIVGHALGFGGVSRMSEPESFSSHEDRPPVVLPQSRSGRSRSAISASGRGDEPLVGSGSDRPGRGRG